MKLDCPMCLAPEAVDVATLTPRVAPRAGCATHEGECPACGWPLLARHCPGAAGDGWGEWALRSASVGRGRGRGSGGAVVTYSNDSEHHCISTVRPPEQSPLWHQKADGVASGT